MSHVVLEVSSSKLEEFKKFYSESASGKLPPGAVFQARTSQCVITGYKSGKVLFQGSGAESEARNWAGSLASSSSKIKKTPNKTSLSHNSFTPSYPMIGSDEVGTGDYFGPITVASVYVTEDQIQMLQSLGVTDSKAMNDDVIRNIAPNLLKTITHHITILPNPKYNEWFEVRGYNQGKIKAVLHNHTIGKLLKKIGTKELGTIVIDQFTLPTTYYNYLKDYPYFVVREKVHFETKAESKYVAVACASVLARYAFLVEWDKMNKQAGIIIPKGASNKVDAIAGNILRTKGEEYLKTLTKWHFANTDKARKLK